MFSAAPLPVSAIPTRTRETNEQPWRSHEAWIALHAVPSPHAVPSAFSPSPLLPSAMGDAGGWKGRGGGNFFGADVKGTLPSRQSKGRGKRAGVEEEVGTDEKMDEWPEVEEEEVERSSPVTTPTRLASPREPPFPALFTPINRQEMRSAYNPRDSTGGHPASSSSSDDRWDVDVHMPMSDSSDDDGLLPPLLPYSSSARPSTFRSLPDPSPIPWGRASPIPWGRASPIPWGGRASPVPTIRTPTTTHPPPSLHSPRSPTLQTASPHSLPSRSVSKTWTRAITSSPRKMRPTFSPWGTRHESEPSRTPTRHRPGAVKFDLGALRENEENEVSPMPKASPSTFWSLPRGWMEKKKVEGERDTVRRGLPFRLSHAGAA